MHIQHVPAAVYPPAGNYVHGVSVPASAKLLFISGTMGLTPEGGIPESFEKQCELVWQHVFAILADAGMSRQNLVKITCFLGDAANRWKNMEIRDRMLGDHRIAVTVVEATLLDNRWFLEMEAVAAG
jgi:enamine deaminase RidA (YjgF/YER057c/UK114 family)